MAAQKNVTVEDVLRAQELVKRARQLGIEVYDKTQQQRTEADRVLDEAKGLVRELYNQLSDADMEHYWEHRSKAQRARLLDS